MNSHEKVQQLRKLIYGTVAPTVSTDFVYLDVPYHFNAGDTLIWEGTLEFLKQLPYKCHGIASANSASATHAIEWCKAQGGASTILLHGGGNFGDLWLTHQRFRNKIIERCPEIPIIILPQTIYFQNQENLERDAALFSKRPNVTLFVRDKVSFDFALKYFPDNHPTLAPDMAFCIEFPTAGIPVPQKDNLFVKRFDKELATLLDYNLVPAGADVSDWPTIENPSHPVRNAHQALLRWCARIDCRLGTKLRDRILDYYWKGETRQAIVKTAIDFIGNYRNVYTTRMHAAILSVLLKREKIVLFDNSYGKSSSFANTWFSDLDNFSLVTGDE